MSKHARHIMVGLLVVGVVILVGAVPGRAAGPYAERDYGAVARAFTSMDVWDATGCDLTITYTLDMSRYKPDNAEVNQWTQVGVTEGALGWMNSGAPEAKNTDPRHYDPDDQFVLASTGQIGEMSYDALGPDRLVRNPVGAAPAAYGMWFDRDGISCAEKKMWGAVRGVNYRTNGLYEVTLTVHSLDKFTGTIFATVNGVPTSFHSVAPAQAFGVKPDITPVGKSFSGDNLRELRVWADVQGTGVRIESLKAEGCLAVAYVEAEARLLTENASNCLSRAEIGQIPLVVMGSEEFIASQVNPETLILEGFDVDLYGIETRAYAQYINDDEYPDLVVEFADDDGAVLEGESYAIFSGQRWDGRLFEGTLDLCIGP